MTLKELEIELRSLLKSRHPGWDRQAEALIARGFYGDAGRMVSAYLFKLEALNKETAT